MRIVENWRRKLGLELSSDGTNAYEREARRQFPVVYMNYRILYVLGMNCGEFKEVFSGKRYVLGVFCSF